MPNESASRILEDGTVHVDEHGIQAHRIHPGPPPAYRVVGRLPGHLVPGDGLGLPEDAAEIVAGGGDGVEAAKGGVGRFPGAVDGEAWRTGRIVVPST
jgi:hypothetical protein